MNERKLKAKCVELDISIDELSKAINKDSSTFYRKLKNDSLTLAEARIIAERLNLTIEEKDIIFFSQSGA